MASGHSKYSVEPFDLSDDAPAYLHDAMKDLGLQEFIMVDGQKKSNPVVERFFEKACGKRYNSIKFPWCAAWLGAKLEWDNRRCTRDLMARSYLKYGEAVEKDMAQPGDIVITWRGRADDGVTGHVFFFLEWNEDGSVKGIGANQEDMVCIGNFPAHKILGIRRPRGVSKSRTVRAAGGSAAAEITSQAVDVAVPSQMHLVGQVADVASQVQGPLEVLSKFKPEIKLLLAAITIGLALYACWCRYEDHRKGYNT